METRIGEWYLCEGYIEEPVTVEALETDKIQVRYLVTGKVRWLGYPRIWHACKPQPLPYQAGYDPRTQLVTLHPNDGTGASQELSLGELRARFFPHLSKPRLVRSKKAARPSRVPADEPVARNSDLLWEVDPDEISSDEEDFALDMSL